MLTNDTLFPGCVVLQAAESIVGSVRRHGHSADIPLGNGRGKIRTLKARVSGDIPIPPPFPIPNFLSPTPPPPGGASGHGGRGGGGAPSRASRGGL